MKFTQLFETSKPRNFSKASGKPSYPKRQYSNSTIAYIQGLIEDSLNAESELEPEIPETQNVQDGLTQNKTMLYDEDNLKAGTVGTVGTVGTEKTETLEKAFSNLENGHTDHFLDMPDESEKTVVTPNEDLEEFQRAMELDDSEGSENASETQETLGELSGNESGESSETKESEEQKDYFLDDPDEEVSEESKEIASRLARNLEDNSDFYLDSEDLETEPVKQENSEELGEDSEESEDSENVPETQENSGKPVIQENSGESSENETEKETPKTPKKTIKESKKPKRSKKAKLPELTEESKDSKELKDEVQDVQATPENPEAIKIYNELIDLIQKKDYDETVDFVDDIVKDPKLKFLLSLGFGGDFSNLKLKLKRTTIPAKRLVPTQNEIGTEATLKFIMPGEAIDVCFEKTTIIIKPIVTFQGTFIVDGHHRWSQIFVTNPDANLVCIDITGNLSPVSMLKAVQCTIGSNLGHLIRKNIKGSNLYDLSEKQIRKYIEDNIQELAVENLSKYYDDPIQALVDNVIQMQRNNTPILNAPDRGEMPQTSKDPELFDDLKNGVTDV